MKEVTGLLVMDVDGTLVRQEGIDLLAQEAGVGQKVAEITAQAMNGELDFKASLQARVALLKGLEASKRFARTRSIPKDLAIGSMTS